MSQVKCLLRTPTLSQRHVDLPVIPTQLYILSFIKIRSGVFFEARGSKFAHSHYLIWLLSFTTACTAVQAVIVFQLSVKNPFKIANRLCPSLCKKQCKSH